MAYDFKTGKYYNLSSTVPTIFGERYERVKFEGKVSYDIARLIKNVDVTHRRAYHHLQGVIDNPATYEYFIFIGEGGSTEVLADPWIDHQSVEVVDTAILDIRVEGIGTSDIEVIRQLLLDAGYTNIKLSS